MDMLLDLVFNKIVLVRTKINKIPAETWHGYRFDLF